MKAAQIKAYDGPLTVRIKEIDRPTAGPGKVLIEVQAAAVNPFDIKVSQGTPPAKTLPATLGGDFAGIITEVGENVTGFSVGQAVYGQASPLNGQGAFAEFTPVLATQVAIKPQSIDFIQAAALPLVASSAYQALVEHMDLQPSQKILIHGAAGGIGSMAIQLAKHIGAQVTTTATQAEAEFVKSLGAGEVIDYRTQDFSQLVKDYDAVFDTVGGETNQKSYQILKSGGTLVSMVEQPNETLVKEHGINYIAQFSQVTTDKLTKIAALVDSGVLQAQVDRTFSLVQTAEAMDYLSHGHPRGKVVIQIKATD